MEPEVRTARSIAPCAKHQDIGRNLAHARFASAANARQSDIQHATVADQSQFSRSWYALTVAQKRIERPAATAHSTARCAKHPVMDTKLKDGQEDGLNLGHSPEMLFDLRANNTPPHLLSLAEGDIVFLMRTLDKRKNLTNNTRLLILDIKTRFIKVQTLGDHPQTHLIPRIRFSFKMHRRKALTVDRLQFPLRLAYAMTFNRAQGQTLDKVLVDGTSRLLRKHDCHGAFTHGQCNVAISRVRRREDIAILVDEHNIVTDAKTGERCALTANIVFKSFIAAE